MLGWDAHYRDLWRQYPLDDVIGSVHWLGHWSIFDPCLPAGRTPEAIYEEYLLTTQAAARSGAYDILGHLDCLKTKGHIPDLTITPVLEATVRVLAESGITVELNTSGWRKPIEECYPRPELLDLCSHYGVPVTLCSDAHEPELVGSGFERGVRLLKDAGYREIATFERRQRIMQPL